MLTGFLSGTAVNNILAASGFSPTYVKYFANAMDTDTQGVDIVGSYETSLGEIDLQDLNLSLNGSFNYNHSRVAALAPTPPQLAGLGFTLYDAQTIGSVTSDMPITKAILSENFNWNSLNFNLRETRYGQYSNLQDAPTPSQTFRPNYLIDVSAGYHFTDKAAVTLGVNNVFNQYPGKSIIPNTTGSPNYAGDSPYGFYGGFYYARLSYNF
jgi:iron complex outermembrane receptor protein